MAPPAFSVAPAFPVAPPAFSVPPPAFSVPPSAFSVPPSAWHLIGKSRLAYTRRVADVFKALADATRRTILDELAERDGQTLFEICGRLSMRHQLGSSRQAISQHLDVLEAAGLVETRRDGRYKFHYLNREPLRHIADRWLLPDEGTTDEADRHEHLR